MTAFWLAHCDNKEDAYSLYVNRFPNERYIKVCPPLFKNKGGNWGPEELKSKSDKSILALVGLATLKLR